MIEPAQRQDVMAEPKAMYLVRFLRRISPFLSRCIDDLVDFERMEELSAASSGVRWVAIVGL